MEHPAEFFIRYLLVMGSNASPESVNSTLELYGISAVSADQLSLYASEVSDVPEGFKPWDRTHRPSTSWLKKKRLFSMVHPSEGTEEMKSGILARPRVREVAEKLILGNVPFAEASYRLTKIGVRLSSTALAEYKHYFWNTDVMGVSDWARYFERDSTRRTSSLKNVYSLSLLAGPEVAMYRVGIQSELDSKKIMLEVQEELYHSFLEAKTLPLSPKKVEMVTGLARSLARIDERVQAGDTALQETLKKFEKFKVLHNKGTPPSLLDLAPSGSVSDRSREEILTSSNGAKR